MSFYFTHMKEYFSHDYATRSDIKIKKMMVKHGILGYGVFWAIVEELYNNANALPTDCDCIAYDLRVDIEVVKSIVFDYDLFVIDGDKFSSMSVERRLSERAQVSKKASESAKARWERNANAMRTHSERNAIKENKRIVKGKKEKENNKNHSPKEVSEINISFDEFWEHYEKKTGDKKKLIPKWQNLTDDERITAMKHISEYKKAQPDKSFRKDPQTYLNNKSFNDEIIYRNAGVKNELPQQQPKERYYTPQEQEQRAKLFAAGFKPVAT